MKKIYVSTITLIFFSFMILGMVSCKKDSFLGATTTTNLTETTIFTDSANAEGFLANIYSNAGFATSASRFVFDPGGKNIPCGGLDAASDESETSHTFSTTALAFAIGSVNAGNVTDDAYKTCYANIRAVNQIFHNLPRIPMKPLNKVEYKAEARFLRAWYYFILLEHYGGVPLIGDTLYTYTQPIPAKRNTFAECVTYISAECDTAYKYLQPITLSQAYGRASGGACMALKARLLLYAASPLFNNPTPGVFNGNKTPADIAANSTVQALVAYPSYVKTRWQDAEIAANNLIQLGAYSLSLKTENIQGYGPVGAFQTLFTLRPNDEYIFQLMEPGDNNILENLFNPPSRDSNGDGAFPYQQTVDAFPMANGKLITDPTSGYDPTNPYANRDPRLAASIIYDQSLLGNRTPNGQIIGYSPVNIYLTNGVGGTDAVYQGTPTGYYNNKMCDPAAVAAAIQAGTNRTIPLIRYAEILLNYCEAANEFEGPTPQVYTYMQQIRARAGLNPAALPPGLTQDQMRTAIQHERQVELAYEGNRFFDVRRWVIADQTENIVGQGMEVDRNGSSATYHIFDVRKHNFHTAMYLWPFPQSEIGKGAGIVQNPGY